jgi:hypothetical protein
MFMELCLAVVEFCASKLTYHFLYTALDKAKPLTG